MRGKKRAALSDAVPATNDSLQQASAIAPSDKPKAESARKHVRALNNQFASWVQTQLKNHPDELWEDGVRDYLAHASNILEKFSDVVNWLRANAGKWENYLSSESQGTEKKLVPEVKSNDIKFFPEKNSFNPTNTTMGLSSLPSSSASNSQPIFFPNSQSGISSGSQSGLFSSSQPGVFSSGQFGLTSNSQSALFGSGQFGLKTSSQTSPFSCGQAGLVSKSRPPFSLSNNQPPALSVVSAPVKRDGSDDAVGEEDETPRPTSPSVKKTEEKGIVVVHEVKCKLYVKSTDPADRDTWKDKGTGKLCIKCKEGIDKGTKESKPTIVVRNDVGKLLLNALLYPGIKTNAQKNSLVAIFHTSDDTNENVARRTFLIRTKTAEDRDQLATAIQEYAPSS